MTPEYYRNLAADCAKVAETAKDNAERYLRLAAALEDSTRPQCGSDPDSIEVQDDCAA